MEKFIDIIGYEGLYQVSNYGNVKSFHSRGGRILKPNINDEYYRVDLCKDGIKKHHRINRLVAIHFIPNPDNKPQVNHKDGNKLNNYVDLLDSDNSNLEWCTQSYNSKHAYRTGLNSNDSQKKKVIQLDLEGNIIKEYESTYEASKQIGVSRSCISLACNGKRETSAGYLWEFK